MIDAVIIVNPDKYISHSVLLVLNRSSVPNIYIIIFIIVNTPTFTTATACNKAETGVGATIAAGNQECSGMIAALATPKMNKASKSPIPRLPISPFA